VADTRDRFCGLSCANIKTSRALGRVAFTISGMYEVRAASPADLDAVIELVVRLQAEPDHLIGFHGTSRAEVAEELGDLRPGWPAGAAVATDRDGRVRGVLSLDVDDSRAYLYGPFVDVPAAHPAAEQVWARTADELFAHLTSTVDGKTLNLFGHRQNRMLADFAARHDVAADQVQRVFELSDGPLRALLVHDADRPSTSDDKVLPLRREDADAVAALHDRCFPGGTTTGAELVAEDGEFTVVAVRGRAGVLGYAAGFTQAEEYFVYSVGVEPTVRSRGVGRMLVRGLLAQLAANTGARNRAAALIRLGNDASERMCSALGFAMTLELVHYRSVSQVTAVAR
jgi:GNAT superfamily N-acetyltransferase